GGGRIAEIARHNGPRVDPDMELNNLAKLARPVCAKVDGTGLNVEGGTKCTLWVILVGNWRTEHRHCGIAHELLHKAIVARDGFTQHRKQSVLEGAHVLRIEALGKCGETRNVGEKYGHLPAIRVS